MKSLDSPITVKDVDTAFARLNNNNNNRACKYVSIPGELLKFAPSERSRLIADMFNEVSGKHIPLEVGTGAQKPGKPLGLLKSLRPIVLLTTLLKTLFLITLHRISYKVNDFLSPSQSGFRRGRSKADVVWGHRWVSRSANDTSTWLKYWVSTYHVRLIQSVQRNAWTFCIRSST